MNTMSLITKEKFMKIKEELKVEARALTDIKAEIKDKQRNRKVVGSLQWKLSCMKHEWRHKHIAYCLIKGRTLESIEGKCDHGNEPNLALVEKYKKGFESDVK